MKTKLYSRIAQLLETIHHCEEISHPWLSRHEQTLADLCEEHLPSGAGFDAGTKLDDSSTPQRLVFITSFHHMNDAGYYDGWTEHTVIVSPSLACGYELKVTGRDRNGVKEHIGEAFADFLDTDV